MLLLLFDVDGRALRKGDAVGLIEGFQVNFPHPDAQLDGHEGAEELAALARIERGRRQLVVAIDGALLVVGGQAAHLPDEVVGGLGRHP